MCILKIILLNVELGTDYGGGGEAVIPPSSTQGDTACADISIINDEVFECTHNFTVALLTATPATDTTGPQAQAVVTIVDDEGTLQAYFYFVLLNVCMD